MDSLSDLSQSSDPNGSLTPTVSAKSNPSDSDDEATTSQTPASRKEKSLGKLCRRFLVAMGQHLQSVGNKRCYGGPIDCSCPGSCQNQKDCRCVEIHLETVAKEMKTEKRRIYDIVNVMEALDAMSKGNKSFYQWNTLASLPIVMDKLQKEAQSEKLFNRVSAVQDAMGKLHEVGLNPSMASKHLEEPKESPVDSSNDKYSNLSKGNKNSLAILCSRFLMVILSNPEDRKVSLDVASTVLIKETDREGYEPPSRSRCRRLYDIANVLVALGLVKKSHYMFGTKKIPMFQYCGPEPESTKEKAHTSMINFLKTANLAAPYDDTWTAIFGFDKTGSTLLPPLTTYKFASIKPSEYGSQKACDSGSAEAKATKKSESTKIIERNINGQRNVMDFNMKNLYSGADKMTNQNILMPFGNLGNLANFGASEGLTGFRIPDLSMLGALNSASTSQNVGIQHLGHGTMNSASVAYTTMNTAAGVQNVNQGTMNSTGIQNLGTINSSIQDTMNLATRLQDLQRQMNPATHVSFKLRKMPSGFNYGTMNLENLGNLNTRTSGASLSTSDSANLTSGAENFVASESMTPLTPQTSNLSTSDALNPPNLERFISGSSEASNPLKPSSTTANSNDIKDEHIIKIESTESVKNEQVPKRRVFGELPVDFQRNTSTMNRNWMGTENKENEPIKEENDENENKSLDGFERPKARRIHYPVPVSTDEPAAKRSRPSDQNVQPAGYESFFGNQPMNAWALQFALLQMQRQNIPPIQMPSNTNSPKAFKPPSKVYPLSSRTNLFNNNN
ncbi:unnamed protein product [Bursaphelenchus okinawaensis]|uniref:E2F/DP family winged-helix DNA-binding domain-containing protein n=1 Tax=Bursaphelenchus okinawaensis TaxID=465554 RepID=A0A811KBW3_9BILA|nr:unnamed protein product [Bursaphelenchus okinawaensis]CAG9098522.1 unnamed protein product [Bursaphelenchus okinawaensis]